jgi:hypothetical protein
MGVLGEVKDHHAGVDVAFVGARNVATHRLHPAVEVRLMPLLIELWIAAGMSGRDESEMPRRDDFKEIWAVVSDDDVAVEIDHATRMGKHFVEVKFGGKAMNWQVPDFD